MVAALGGVVMAVGVILAMFVFRDPSGGPNYPLLLGGVGVGAVIEVVGVGLLVRHRQGR